MKVSELLEHLYRYACASPDNLQAEVLLRMNEELCVELAGAQDCRGMPGRHFLVLGPDYGGLRVVAKEMRLQ